MIHQRVITMLIKWESLLDKYSWFFDIIKIKKPILHNNRVIVGVSREKKLEYKERKFKPLPSPVARVPRNDCRANISKKKKK